MRLLRNLLKETMEKEDIFEEIVEMGKSRGKLTYDEINDALPSEYFSMDEMEELIDLLHDMGIKVVDDEEPDTYDEEILASEKEEEHEKTEDIVQTYFHSMGDISVLKRDEEIELAKKLEEGKEIIREIVTTLPIYKKIEASLDQKEAEDLRSLEEANTDEALEMSLRVLDNLMIKIELADKKVARYGTLRDLKKLITEKKKRDINPIHLNALAKEVQNEYKQVESEAGIKIDELKAKWERITKARFLA